VLNQNKKKEKKREKMINKMSEIATITCYWLFGDIIGIFSLFLLE
jgi:hypothetical protein